MTRIAAILSLAGVAVASAQRNAIDIKVRQLGGEITQWVDEIYVNNPNNTDPFHIEVGVFYERASGYGFSGSVHSVTVSNWAVNDSVTLLDRPDSALHPDGRQGRFNFGAQRQQAYSTGLDAGQLRIAAANNTQNASAGGISVKQNTPAASGSLFDTDNPVLGFRFDLTLALRSDDFVNTYELLSPANRIANFAIYQTESSTSGTNLPLDSVVLDGAIVRTSWLVPAPSAIFVLVSGEMVMGRRRRSAM